MRGIAKLPPSVRRELDQRIADSGFRGYAGHKAWLQRQGHDIALRTLSHHGRRLKLAAEGTRLAERQARADAIAGAVVRALLGRR